MNRILPALGTVCLVLFVWQVLSLLQWIPAVLIPSPIKVFGIVPDLASTGDLSIWPDLLATLFRVLLAFSVAVLIGLPIGLLMGYFESVYMALAFLIDFFRSIPATALFPLFLLLFGVGDESKIAVAGFACMLIVLFNTMYGVHQAKKLRITVARIMGLSGFSLFSKVIFWDALPFIFSGFRLSISLALIVVVVTEMFIGTNLGIGHRILDAQLVYNVPEMYAAIIFAGTLGYLLNFVMALIEVRMVHWAGK